MYKKILGIIFLFAVLSTQFIKSQFILTPALQAEFLSLKKEFSKELELSFLQEKLSQSDIQLLSNIFLCALNYSHADLYYNKIKRHILMCILNLQELTPELDDHENLTNELIHFNKLFVQSQQTRNKNLILWNSVINYLDASENTNAHNYLRAIAEERAQLITHYLSAQNEISDTIITQLSENFKQSAQQTNILGNCMEGIHDDALPFNDLQKLEAVNNAIAMIKKEIITLTHLTHMFNDYYESYLELSMFIDIVYYQALYEFIHNTFEQNYHMLMFNVQGLIPEDQRCELLPIVEYIQSTQE